MKVSLIIAAGGAGKRFGANKLFVTLGEKAVLCHALDSFEGIPQIKEVVLAVPAGTEKWVKANVLKSSKIPARLVKGGATRAESVWKALCSTSPKSSWVLVHDGARPFPPRKAVLELLRKGKSTPLNGRGNVAPVAGFVLARPVIPTLKRISSGNKTILGTVDRRNLYEAETPQLVRRDLLLEAYKKNPKAFSATDESSLIESVGGKMKIVSHFGWNVKITTPEDLRLAEAHLHSSNAGAEPIVPLHVVGFGRDTHRLAPGRKFCLGGIQIPFEKGSLGHSDGDALLHAISDAMLGATGLGDIGDWFPPGDARYKNFRSERFVKKILVALREKGWQPERIDTVTILERPKLAPYKPKIRKRISQILGIPTDHISIKAKTQEGLGPEGEGLAVTCEALVTLRRI